MCIFDKNGPPVHKICAQIFPEFYTPIFHEFTLVRLTFCEFLCAHFVHILQISENVFCKFPENFVDKIFRKFPEFHPQRSPDDPPEFACYNVLFPENFREFFREKFRKKNVQNAQKKFPEKCTKIFALFAHENFDKKLVIPV